MHETKPNLSKVVMSNRAKFCMLFWHISFTIGSRKINRAGKCDFGCRSSHLAVYLLAV